MRWQLTGPLSHGRKFCSTLFYAVPHCYTNFELHRERVGRIRTPNCLTTTARCLRPRPPLMNHWATVAFLRRPSRRRHGGNAGQKQNRRLHEPTLPVVPRRLVNAISPPRRPAAPSPCGSHVGDWPTSRACAEPALPLAEQEAMTEARAGIDSVDRCRYTHLDLVRAVLAATAC